MQKLDRLIQELESNIKNFEVANPLVSKAAVGWHIDHCLVIISRVISALEKSDPAEFKPQFSWKRVLIFATNTVPRGKIKAPDVALPQGEITEESLKGNLEKVKEKILKIEKFDKNNFFPHPFLNDLNVKQTQKFLILHTTHHVKIIRDILKK